MDQNKISLLTRADDLGSSHAANIAIAEAAVTGDFIKNVSCMAVGPLIEEGVSLIKECSQICFGLHATLNAEWDLIKWGPISPPEEVPSITAPNGALFNDPTYFVANPPDLGQIILEFDRQLDLLTQLGLDVRYVDSHMFPELYVDGLSQAMSDWIKRKGLIDHIPYYRFAPKPEPGPSVTLEAGLAAVTTWLDQLEYGGYFSVMHPARYSREMLLCKNKQVPTGVVAACRDVEYRLLLSRQLDRYCEEHNLRRVRYDEAQPQGTTFQDLRNLFLRSPEGYRNEQ